MDNDEVETSDTVPSQVEVPYSVTSRDWNKYKKNTLASEISEMFFKKDVPKWIPNPVYFTFEDPEVRKKLIKLINTDVVKVMDKDFMCNLQNKLYESYWTAFEERLDARRKWESERRKGLALDGIQPLDDNSLEKHPIIEVRNQVEKAFQAIKKKTEKPYQTRKKMTWDYKQFTVKSPEESVASDESELEKDPEVDFVEIERKKKQLDMKMEPSYTTLMSQEFYHRIKYEPSLVKDLKAAHVNCERPIRNR
ncbi:uncharacterized protein [Halyomorpha halys]|uniref:uncharacterized protein isoform X2 n=1 Tax=Halyomorpha halys TaxID=286706 RepID=UPI0006D4DD70|nr:uncharacterized protein LOC106687248 isoform X2 [Halyomorpha halys]